MFNPKARKAAEELRATRYQQLIFFFLVLGLSPAVILLLLDLPAAVRKGEQQAQKLLQQSLSIQSSNPELADTLAKTAYRLMLQTNVPADANTLAEPLDSNPDDIAKTIAVVKPEKVTRYIG